MKYVLYSVEKYRYWICETNNYNKLKSLCEPDAIFIDIDKELYDFLVKFNEEFIEVSSGDRWYRV